MATLKLTVDVAVPGVEGLTKVTTQLEGVEKAADKTGSVTQGVFQGIGQAVAGAAIGLAKAGVDAVVDKIGDSLELASNKAEAASKVNVLYGQSAHIVTEASEDAATSVGLSSGAYLESAGNLGNLITNLGFTGDEAANMSVEMLQLAGDMGSFNNASTEEVTEAMGAAFRGETEPIRRFGVMLDDASVKAKAMELGLYSGVGALDKNAKATATYQLILEQTTEAQGDFARTSDGLANSQKIAGAKMDDAWTRVGEALTPIAQTILPLIADAVVFVADGINFLITAIADWVDDNRALVDSIIDVGKFLWDLYTKYIGALVEAIGELGYRVGGLIGLFVDLAGAIVDMGGALAAVMRGDFEAAAVHGQLLVTRLQGFQENVQRAIGDTARRAADETSIQIARITTDVGTGAVYSMSAIAGAYNAGEPYVARAAQEVGEALPEAMEEGSAAAAAEAAKTPGEIADGLRSGRSAVTSAMDQLKDDMHNSIKPAKEIAQLEGQLSGKAIAKGLASQDPIVRSQAQATVEAIETRLAELKGVGTEAGSDTGEGLQTGIRNEDPAVKAVAASTNKVVTTQFNLMEQGSRIAGQTAALTLAQALGAGAGAARQAGVNVGEAWGLGVVQGVRNSRDNIASAAAYATAPIRGHSPPRVGPLRDIDKWGESVGGAWSEGVSKGIGPLGLDASPGSMGRGAGMGGGAPTIIIQTGVGDPVAIGREVVDAITAYERSGGRSWRES